MSALVKSSHLLRSMEGVKGDLFNLKGTLYLKKGSNWEVSIASAEFIVEHRISPIKYLLNVRNLVQGLEEN